MNVRYVKGVPTVDEFNALTLSSLTTSFTNKLSSGITIATLEKMGIYTFTTTQKAHVEQLVLISTGNNISWDVIASTMTVADFFELLLGV